jgi:hypothetical protein
MLLAIEDSPGSSIAGECPPHMTHSSCGVSNRGTVRVSKISIVNTAIAACERIRSASRADGIATASRREPTWRYITSPQFSADASARARPDFIRARALRSSARSPTALLVIEARFSSEIRRAVP